MLTGADSGGSASTAKGASAVPAAHGPAPRSASAKPRARKAGVQTVVATGDASIAALVQGKKRIVDEHRQRRTALQGRLENVERQLRSLKRTKRNVRTYNSLIEQRDTIQRNLAIHDASEPQVDDFYDNLRAFFAQNSPAVDDNGGKSAANKAQNADLHPATDNTCTDTSTADSASVGTVGIDFKSAASAPAHRASTVTSGMPVFDANQFALLRLGRADIVQRQKRQIDGDIDRSHGVRADERINALLAQRLRSEIDLEQLCLPMAFVLSPLGTGLLPPCTPEQQAATRAALDAALHCAPGSVQHGGVGGACGGENSQKALTVTIGKASGAGKKAKRAASARLDVKMKDIRNMQNLSIRNFVSVTERQRTHEEVQHENFKQFLAERAQAAEQRLRPQYSDGVCEACGGELDIDVHGGVVSCIACGAAYSDGIDSHQWHAVPHVPHSKFQYLKSGHLVSLLKRFQGKEHTVIPRDVINRVVLRLHEDKYDLRAVGYKEIKIVLRKLNLSRYYDHVWQLLYIATGRKPWQFTAKEEIEFQVVFDVLEQVYPLFKPPESENFIFYWYFIKKTAQLLGQPDKVVDMFPVLKSSRLHQQKERIWKKMVEHVGWPYFVTYHDTESRKAMNL